MKKVIIIFTVIILSIFTVFSFSACNAIEGNDLSGTYRLESWTETPPDSETIDWKEKKNIYSYLIITDDDTGWYIYKSENLEIYSEIKITRNYNEKGKVSTINIEYSRTNDPRREDVLFNTTYYTDKKGVIVYLRFQNPIAINEKYLKQNPYSIEFKKVSPITTTEFARKDMSVDSLPEFEKLKERNEA